MPDIFSILQNFSNSLPGLYQLVTGTSVLAGFWFVMRSIYQLKQYGELRTMMASQTDLKKPLIFLFVGISLMFWPSLLTTVMQTVFQTNNPLQYSSSGMGGEYDLTMNIAGRIIQLLGLIAFVRGWMLLTAYAEGGGQQNPISKALTHIFGGVLAINIFATWDIIKNTIGI